MKTLEEYRSDLLNNVYTWGKFILMHRIAEFTIVEYKPRLYKDGKYIKGAYEEKNHFHPYIGTRDTNRSFETLEEAMVGMVAYKYDGCNTRADGYFIRGLMHDGRLEQHKDSVSTKTDLP